MATAKITLSTGAIVSIEGTKEEVASILVQFETGKSAPATRKTEKVEGGSSKVQPRRVGASDLVLALKEEGFFKETRTLGAIAGAVEERGYIYPVTTLSGVVLGLVKKRVLGRKKVGGKWVYGN